MSHIVPLDSITSGVVDAVEAWNDYLAGDGGWTPQAMAAHIVFVDELGAPWSPTRAANAAEMRALRALGRVVDIWREHPWFFTRRRLSAPLSKAGGAVRYLAEALGVAVHADMASSSALMRAHAPVSHGRILRHVAAVGMDAIAADGGVPASDTRAQPPGYAIKGNAQSGLFHPPGARWYEQTQPEFWFADAASAIRAGFAAVRH